jgi:hypothetical protein
VSFKAGLTIFHKIIKPILLFDCEIWEHGTNGIVERNQLLLKLKSLLLQVVKCYMVQNFVSLSNIDFVQKEIVITYMLISKG